MLLTGPRTFPGRQSVMGGPVARPIDPDVLALFAAIPRGWDTGRHAGDNAKAAAAVRAFRLKKGL